jgi:two-component sensor histidine kinase
LVLDWRESGVKNVEEPTAKGFGTTLLGRIMARQHGGNTQMIWEEDGLHFIGELPLNSEDGKKSA